MNEATPVMLPLTYITPSKSKMWTLIAVMTFLLVPTIHGHAIVQTDLVNEESSPSTVKYPRYELKTTTERAQYQTGTHGDLAMDEQDPNAGGLKPEVTAEDGQENSILDTTTERGLDTWTVPVEPPLFEYPQAGGLKPEATAEGSEDNSQVMDGAQGDWTFLAGSAPAEGNHGNGGTPMDGSHEPVHHATSVLEPRPETRNTEVRNESTMDFADFGHEDSVGETHGEGEVVRDNNNNNNSSSSNDNNFDDQDGNMAIIEFEDWDEPKVEDVIDESYVNHTMHEMDSSAAKKRHFANGAADPAETKEIDREDLPSNETHFGFESTNETESETIQEMLAKLNVMIEKHKHCNHDLPPDIDPKFSTMSRSDVQGDSDTEESNETKRTIIEIIKKLNGIMFNGNGCIGDKNETKDNETAATFPESSLTEITSQTDDKLKNENENKMEQKSEADADDSIEDIITFDHENLDWSIFEHHRREIKVRIVDVECRVDLDLEEKEKKDEPIDFEGWHVFENRSHRQYHHRPYFYHWDDGAKETGTNCETPRPDGNVEKDDDSCPGSNGYRRPCFDIMSQESVLSQLCRRLSLLEQEIRNVTSGASSLLHQNEKDRLDLYSRLLSEIGELKKETESLKRKSAFQASAPLKLGQLTDYKVHINQGDWFDANTGVYTAPISGVYHILVHQQSHSQADAEHVIIKIKDGGSPDSVVISGKLSESLNTLTHLDTGQTIWLEVEVVSGHHPNNDVILNGLITFGAFKVD